MAANHRARAPAVHRRLGHCDRRRLEIIGAIKLRNEIEGEWLLIASGVLSVIFGLLVIAWPGAGALAMVLVIGSFAILFGILMIGFSLKLRKAAECGSKRAKRARSAKLARRRISFP